MIAKSQIESIIGQDLLSGDGSKVGKIGMVFLDAVRDEPEWITVNTGLFGTNESFVPLAEAGLGDGGVTVPYTKDQIKDAPNVSDSGALSEPEEQRLYEHYGVPYTTEGSTFADTAALAGITGSQHTAVQDTPVQDTPVQDTPVQDTTGQGADPTVGHDTSGPTTDDAMTRSEEQLHVGTEQVQTGRVRLRKYVVTENVTRTVPVSHEEVRLEREPITEANRPAAVDGPELSEEEHEVTLSEERVVVEKEVVPVERVRLDTETLTENEQVDVDVRKEQIELDSDTGVNVRGDN